MLVYNFYSTLPENLEPWCLFCLWYQSHICCCRICGCNCL